jgi:hypothetical protein
MPMKSNLVDREFEKFVETPDGDTAVRVTDVGGGSLAAPGIGDIQSFNGVASAAIGATGPLADRKGLFIQPTAAGLFMGFDAGVTIATGLKLFQDQIVYVEAGENCPVYLITSGAAITARVWEVR